MYKITHSESYFNHFGVAMFCVVVIAYIKLLHKQHSLIVKDPRSSRLYVLSCRAAIALPVYALVMFLSLIYPHTFYALKVPVAFFEGYSFYCFFALVIENLGGPNRAVKVLINNDKDLCCYYICPNNKETFYLRTLNSEWHFVHTRTAFVLISTIFYYLKLKLVFIVFQVLAFLILSNGIMSILNLYENVMNECKNINGIYKFFILKFAVGLMVVQGLFVEFIIATKKSHIHEVLKPTLHYGPEERAIRIFCFVTLLEYMLLSLGMYFAFSVEMPPNHKERREHRGLLDAQSIANPRIVTAPATPSPIAITFTEFLGGILKFSDVFRVLEEKLELENADELDAI